jgi:ubiquinone/menaquinone biosynthesis C-methylase UbiE
MSRQPGYVDTDYLDVTRDRVLRDKKRSYEYMHITHGDTVIEVGCGPASDTLSLAGLVGPKGHVMGVDIDPEMVTAANARAEAGGFRDTVTHIVADAYSLPYDDDVFDGARSERLFQHLQEPAAVLREMIRVTKRGGRVVVMDMDWGTVSIDSREIDIERRLLRFKADRLHANGYVGRQLNRLFREAGLLDVQIEPRPITSRDLAFIRFALGFDVLESRAIEEGVVSGEEAARWTAGLEAAASRDAFFASGMMMIAAGSKPSRG